jgi:hypothetical protein
LIMIGASTFWLPRGSYNSKFGPDLTSTTHYCNQVLFALCRHRLAVAWTTSAFNSCPKVLPLAVSRTTSVHRTPIRNYTARSNSGLQ